MSIQQHEIDRIVCLMNRLYDRYGFCQCEDADMLEEAWNALWSIREREGIITASIGIEKLDWQIGNLANDLTDALLNAKRYQDVIALCNQILQLEWTDEKGHTDPLFHENAKRDMADSYAWMGDLAKARTMYEKYLAEDPEWGWGWIGYIRILKQQGSTDYESTVNKLFQIACSGQILRDREDVYMELEEIYRESDKVKAQKCRAKIQMTREFQQKRNAKLLRQTTTVNQPIKKERKIGRNEPCPCGSGKKYKKCCGR